MTDSGSVICGWPSKVFLFASVQTCCRGHYITCFRIPVPLNGLQEKDCMVNTNILFFFYCIAYYFAALFIQTIQTNNQF